MTHTVISSLTCLALLLATHGCTGCSSDNTVVPRPMAYPHIDTPDSLYRDITAGGVRLRVNDNAEVDMSQHGEGVWIDISYPIYTNPRMHLTLTQCGAERLDDVLANRQEREALNLGGQRYELTELVTPGGWTCTMSVARGALTTPVQILAYDSANVLSGALTLALPDSLSDPQMAAPVIDMIRRDMTTLLKGLGNE